MKTKPRLYKGNGIWWCEFDGRGWWGSTWKQAYASFESYAQKMARFHEK